MLPLFLEGMNMKNCVPKCGPDLCDCGYNKPQRFLMSVPFTKFEMVVGAIMLCVVIWAMVR